MPIYNSVLLIYCSVINEKNVSISSFNWPHNFKQLPCSINGLKKYTNYPNIAIVGNNSNFKPLLVLKMMYFNIIFPHKLCFLIKMRGRTTSYEKRFRRYQNEGAHDFIRKEVQEISKSPPPPKKKNQNHQLFMKWRHRFRKFEKMWISHKLHLIRNISMVKVAKKTSLLKICTTYILIRPTTVPESLF